MANKSDKLQGLRYPWQLNAPATSEFSFLVDKKMSKLGGKNVYLGCRRRCAFLWIMVDVRFNKVTYLERLAVGTTLGLLCTISVAPRRLPIAGTERGHLRSQR
jgi:hypothetical protein